MAEADRLFAARGYSDVSMRDVADAAGVTKAALYYHFKDKADLYTRVGVQRIDRLRDAMDSAVDGGGSLEDRLVRLTEVALERMATEVFQPHLHSHEHLDEAHHLELHRAMDRLQEPAIRCFVETGAPERPLAPRTAAALLGGISFSLLFVGDEVFGDVDLPKDPSERARLVVRLFLDGYRGLIGEGTVVVPEVLGS
jgi:AcrR family transcriptional regulator